MNPSLLFFSPEREYIELELTSEDPQGAHEAGVCPEGGGRLAPSWTGCGPLVLILSPVFIIYSKTCLH